MATKITKSQMFNQIRAHLTDADEIAFIDHELELIANKAARAKDATRKPTKTQLANADLKSNILDYMKSIATPVTIADVKTKFDLSSQKVTPLMNALVEDNKVSKIVDKRTAIYSVI